jgi:hypothetical protein
MLDKAHADQAEHEPDEGDDTRSQPEREHIAGEE